MDCRVAVGEAYTKFNCQGILDNCLGWEKLSDKTLLGGGMGCGVVTKDEIENGLVRLGVKAGMMLEVQVNNTVELYRQALLSDPFKLYGLA